MSFYLQVRAWRPASGCLRRSGESDIVLAQLKRIFSKLPYQPHYVIIILAGYAIGNRVVRLEDEPASLGGIQFGEDGGLDLLFCSVRPKQHIHVSAETHAMAELAAKGNNVQARFGFQRIVGVNANLNEVPKNLAGIAAAMVDHRQAMLVALIDEGLDARLEVLPPKVGGEEHPVFVGDVAPHHHAVQHAARSRDLGFQDSERKRVDAFDETRDVIRVEPYPEQGMFRTDDAPQHFMALANASEGGEIRMRLAQAIDESGKIGHISIAHAVELVVAGVEVAALVPGIVELEGLHLFDGVGFKFQIGGHGIIALLLQDS